MGFRHSVDETLGGIIAWEITRRQKGRYPKVTSRLYEVSKREALSGRHFENVGNFDLPVHPGDLLGQWAEGRRDGIEFDLFERDRLIGSRLV